MDRSLLPATVFFSPFLFCVRSVARENKTLALHALRNSRSAEPYGKCDSLETENGQAQKFRPLSSLREVGFKRISKASSEIKILITKSSCEDYAIYSTGLCLDTAGSLKSRELVEGRCH